MKRLLPYVWPVLAWAAVALAVVALLALTVLTAFLGQVVDPFFWVFPFAIIGGLAGVACWVVCDIRCTQADAPGGAQDETPDVGTFAGHKPPSRRRDPRRWLRSIRHVGNRTKEEVSQR